MVEVKKPATASKPPKGGRKGGTIFPKVDLEQALVYSKRLVSKTHTGPQPGKIILPGVFESAGARGKIRASALKQYGLLEGGAAAYKATKLAKQIDAAPWNERPPLLQQAFHNSKLFSLIFQTFSGDTVSKAKIEQCAKGLRVHPESAGECAQLFIDSAATAAIGKLNGNDIDLYTSSETAARAESLPTEADDETAGADADDEKADNIHGASESDGNVRDKSASEFESKKPGEQSTRPASSSHVCPE